MAIGFDADVAGANGGVAIGILSRSRGEGSIAMGNAAQTGDAKITGSGVNAIAIGNGAQAVGDNSISIGTGNVVSGNRSGAIGDPTFIRGDDSYAIGNNNEMDAGQAFVLGNNVKVASGLDGAVVLGNDSTVAAATGTPTGDINGETYSYAGGAPAAGDVVSVGSDTAPRQIQNVAAGQVTATSTDAVNGSQLYATHQAIKTLDGNVVKYDVDTVTGDVDYTNVTLNKGGAATTIHNVAPGVADNDAVNVSQLTTTVTDATKYFNAKSTLPDSEATGTDSIAVGPNAKAGGSNTIAMGNGATAQSESGIALGTGASSGNAYGVAIGENSSSSGLNAVALGRLTIANGEVSTAIGYLSEADGDGAIALGASSRAVQNNAVAIGTGAVADGPSSIAMGNGAQALGDSSISIGTGNVVNGDRSGAIGDPNTIDANDSYALGNDNLIDTGADGSFDDVNFTSVTTGATKIDNSGVAVGSSTLGATGLVIAGGPSVTTGGIDAANTVITNVAEGAVNATSKEAVNGSQLNATNTNVTNLDGRVDAQAGLGWNLGANGGAAQNVAPGGTVELIDGQNILITQDATNKITVATADDVNFTSVTTGKTVVDTTGVAVGTDVKLSENGLTIGTTGPSVTMTGISAGGMSITNVADGVAPSDAVNLSQLKSYSDKAATMWITGNPTSYAPPSALGSNSLAVGSGAGSSGQNSVALGNGSNDGARNNVVSVGSASPGNERQITNVAGGTEDTDAVNVRQLRAVAVDGGVRYDQNADGTTNYNNVTMGNGQAPNGTRISNVAPGIAGTDAVNMNQLNATNSRIEDVARNAYAGVAAAMATQMPGTYVPGKTVMRVGSAVFKGEPAVGVSFRRTSENNGWSVTGGVGMSRAGVAATVGAEWVFN
ncbi:cell surface protein [Variovorax sp. WDL1]|nr:cell surface protein [Variovorax sp. WDL1]